MLLVDVNDFLDLIMASEEDSGSVVDMLRDNLKHTIHLAIHCLSTSCNSGQ